MNPEFYVAGERRDAWAAGRAVCPECRRLGCRGQCGCVCRGCKETPVDSWDAGACDVIRDMRARATPEGRAAAKKAYLEELAGRVSGRVTWGECVAQVERVGCPHRTAAAARRPDDTASMRGAKAWWNLARGGKPTLVLHGATGCGKSVAAAYVATKFAETRTWWTSQAGGQMRAPLVWMLGEELGRLALLREQDEALVQRAEAAEFLVIDEVGATGAKAGLLALGQLIARRIDSGRPTVLTTNADGETLAEPLGQHVVDRMRGAYRVGSVEKSLRGGR